MDHSYHRITARNSQLTRINDENEQPDEVRAPQVKKSGEKRKKKNEMSAIVKMKAKKDGEEKVKKNFKSVKPTKCSREKKDKKKKKKKFNKLFTNLQMSPKESNALTADLPGTVRKSSPADTEHSTDPSLKNSSANDLLIFPSVNERNRHINMAAGVGKDVTWKNKRYYLKSLPPRPMSYRSPAHSNSDLESPEKSPRKMAPRNSEELSTSLAEMFLRRLSWKKSAEFKAVLRERVMHWNRQHRAKRTSMSFEDGRGSTGKHHGAFGVPSVDRMAMAEDKTNVETSRDRDNRGVGHGFGVPGSSTSRRRRKAATVSVTEKSASATTPGNSFPGQDSPLDLSLPWRKRATDERSLEKGTNRKWSAKQGTTTTMPPASFHRCRPDRP